MEFLENYFWVIGLVAGLLGMALAHWKGRNKILWFVICLFTTLFGLIVIAIMPKAKTEGGNISEDSVPEKKAGKSKRIPIIGIVAFAVGYGVFLEFKKSDTSEQYKTAFIESCQSDAACLEKIESNFDQCIDTFMSIEKTGKRSADVALDLPGLKACIGL